MTQLPYNNIKMIEICWTNVYTGTIESFNQMIKDLEYDVNVHTIIFCDGNFNDCLIFTGCYKVYPMGILWKPGDVYQYKKSKDMA